MRPDPFRSVFLALFLLGAAVILHWPDARGGHVTFNSALTIESSPLPFALSTPEQTQFGRLTLLSAIELTGSRGFGGISDIALSQDGKTMLAISDSGHWIHAKLVYEGDRLTRLTDASIASIRDRLGAPLDGKGQHDAEGLALLPGPYLEEHVLVSFERDHRLVAYTRGQGSIPARAGDEWRPGVFRNLGDNRGIEAVGVFPPDSALAGQILAIAERNPAAISLHAGWLLDPVRHDGAVPVSIIRTDGFDVTDIAILQNSDVLLLERRYTPFLGAAMRLKLLGLRDIISGAPITGEALLEAGGGYNVDNMEALAVHQDALGQTIITIVSDDNFSTNQSTLLFQFRLQ